VEKVRDGGRVVNKALVIAHAVHESARGYVSAESLSLVLAGPDAPPTQQAEEDVPALQAA